MYKYITDEIKEYINRLIAKGKTGTSNAYNGISPIDENHLTSLLIQAIPSSRLPTLTELDIHNGLPVMISRYVAKKDAYQANELATYISNLYMDHFLPFIKELLDVAIQEYKEKEIA